MAKEKAVFFGYNDASLRFMTRHMNDLEVIAFIEERLALIGNGVTLRTDGGGQYTGSPNL